MAGLNLIDFSLGMCWNKVYKLWRRDKRIFAVFAVLIIWLTYYMYTTLTMPVRFLFVNEHVNKQCIIPDLDPFDKSVMKYVWSPDPIRCDPAPDLVYVDENGFLTYNQSAFKFYGDSSYRCSYSPLLRPKGDDYSVTFGEEVSCTIPVQVPHDFFRLRCHATTGGKRVFDTLQESLFVPDKIKSEHSNENAELSKYSVFMFGIDSTSRLSAIRKLPKTYKYLTEVLGAYVFKGYMKVGDNTFPNIVPVLTGKRPGTIDLPPTDGGQFDLQNFPFIWQKFSMENYATFYAEDYPIITAFNTEATGFKDPPTHHYMRPWMLGVRKIEFASEVLKSVLLPFEYKKLNIGTSSLCYGNKPVFKHLINYYKRFATMYKSKLRFAFSWLVQICHEFVNFLELGDNDFYEFFKFLKENGHLENAFLIFLSDHGSRIDDIRNTFVGRIEERMPLLSIVPPESFRSQFPGAVKNLKDNTERLTSNFDLHEMLNDILNGDFKAPLKFNPKKKRGISLFQSIPNSRSCAEASIPEHFCSCYGSESVGVKSPNVVKASEYAVQHLNNLLKQYTDICVHLTLFKIHEAHLISLGLSAKGEEENRWTIYKFFSKPEAVKHKRYLVIFETLPGNAMFEATVDYHIETGMKITDDVSRTNKYGNTSICVPEKPLRRYCYCKSNIK